MLKEQKQTAFTIVELLVVIVIIGILAAITIVSYSGINNRAIGAVLKGDLDSSAKLLKMYNAEHGYYPDSLDEKYCPATPTVDERYCLKASSGTTIDYTGGDQVFTVVSTHTSSAISYQITENGEPTATETAGGGSSGGGSSNVGYAAILGGDKMDLGNSIVKTDDGNYMVGGTVDSATGVSKALLAKFSADANLMWTQTWDGIKQETGGAAIQTSDGGYALAGMTTTFGAGTDSDIALVKFTSDGTLSWNKTLSINGVKGDIAYDLVQANDGGYVLTGGTVNGYVYSIYDLFLSKFDSNGNILWTRTWGSTSNEYGKKVIKTSDGGYAVTGWAGDTRGGGAWDVFLNKYTSDGSLSWSKMWGGVASEQGYYVVQTSDGGYAVTGYTESFGAGNYDMFLTKFDSSGSLMWSKTWGGAGLDMGRSVIQTNDGGLMVVGSEASFSAGSGDIFLAKYTADGNLSWSKTWGGASNETGGMVIQNSDNSYVVTAATYSYGSGNYDIALLKFSSNGDMNNCSSPMCQSPTATENSPTVSVMTNNPAFTILTNPSNTVGTPSATLAPFSGVHSFVVSP